MKNILCIILAICMLFSLSSCSLFLLYNTVETDNIPDKPIGDDWHVWGMYDFVTIGETEVGIKKDYNGDKQFMGYSIYADGESQGPLLGELNCSSDFYMPEDLDEKADLIYKDYTDDGIIDVGMPLRDGSIMWYNQTNDSGFEFYETEIRDSDFVDWHDWDNFFFEKVDGNLTVGISVTGAEHDEVGYNVFVDLGPTRGAHIGMLRFADGGFDREDFDIDDCLEFEDYNKDGVGDIGLETKKDQTMWYCRDDNGKFSYIETITEVD